jgi:hypothetical protein
MVYINRRLEAVYLPDDKGNMFLRNVGKSVKAGTVEA